MIKDSKSLPKSWERMVIINDLHETTKEKEYTKDNFLYRVKCTWKSFQVALAYEEDGKYYIYYVLFKYNIRGLPGDTLNKWIITWRGTFKSRQILKGNISRTDSYWPHE